MKTALRIATAPPCRIYSSSRHPRHTFPRYYHSSRTTKMATTQPAGPAKVPDDPIEAAKYWAADRAVRENFDPASKYVGIGSGTTIVHVVRVVAALSTNPAIQYIPTGYHSRQVIVDAGLTPVAFDSLPPDTILDVAFDGADEVDTDLNCVKGGGACHFQEKLVAMRSRRFICVADSRKDQPNLLTKWAAVPVEVVPMAAGVVLKALRVLGSRDPKVRENPLVKTGPLKTDQDNFVIDAPFAPLLVSEEAKGLAEGATGIGEGMEKRWDVVALATAIKMIPGVLEVGLFCGVNGVEAQKAGLAGGGQKPVAAYFGHPDGKVTVRRAPGI